MRSSIGQVSFQGIGFFLLAPGLYLLPMFPVYFLPMYPICTSPNPLPRWGRGEGEGETNRQRGG